MAEQEGQQRRRGISPADLVHRGLQAKNAIGVVGGFFANPASWAILVPAILLVLGLLIIIVIPGGAAPLEISKEPTSPGIGGTISLPSCQFIRSDQKPPQASFKSRKLLGYIENASGISTIPPVVLAAFIRIESPDSVNKNDEEIDSFCPESEDGALGIMQLIPHKKFAQAKFEPRKDAVCLDCLQNGAKLLGKSLENVEWDDYCNVQKNIILGSGFILKKMQYRNYGDGTQWDQKWTNDKIALAELAHGYYGCYYYPKPYCDDGGPYNYGEDLWASIQNCPQMTAGFPWGCPAAGSISAPYGFNLSDYPDVGNEGCGDLKSCHNGIDIAASLGTEIKSPLEGVIKNDSDLNIGGLIGGPKGNFVTITNQTSGVSVIFEHLGDFAVRQGATVYKGQIIGTVGDTGKGVTGPVLHYKIIDKNGKLLNPFRYLGPSFKSGPDALFSSDEISANNYAGKTSNNWGVCN